MTPITLLLLALAQPPATIEPVIIEAPRIPAPECVGCTPWERAESEACNVAR